MGARRLRREQRQADMKESRHLNGIRKPLERERRRLRMIEIIKKGQFPYTPVVQSWLSMQLNKPSRLITKEEVDRLLQ